jgi:hypothetical protein
MMFLIGMFRLLLKLIWSVMVELACLSLIFILYQGNQPMHVQAAPKGMTYFEFMADRVEAAKVVKPSQCGWGMFLTLAVLGPTYSALYTEIGLHPGGFWDRVSAPIQIFQKAWSARSGMKCPISGGMLSSSSPGPC